MRANLVLTGLADLLINLSAGWFGLVVFSPIFKGSLYAILLNIINGIVYFSLAVIIKNYESN